MEESFKLKKRQLLRNNEYYTMQDVFDKLYEKSCKDYKFTNLLQYITLEQNILLAYRNIKKNKGSRTIGTDNMDITFFEKMETNELVKYIQRKFANYFPKSVRRVEIPKSNGKKRPLGIPCMDDRIMQQCIKQVLEPICEAKFHNHSYGFRPNRSVQNAIARCASLINVSQLHYVVDIDVKSFFDNVNHSKLKKQIWNMGIQDKNIISILGKILKSEIEGIGMPTKGTPQGGIISPLLSNIVLNELDWWISSQWETFKTVHEYEYKNKYKALKGTELKEVWLVRYADDFRIFCRDYKTAQKIFNATRLWLKERLDLDINTEKSKITNLRKNCTEYLGFKLYAKPRGNKYICRSKMCDKAKMNTIKKLKEQIKVIQRYNQGVEITKLNSIILGSHNYYKCATLISKDFADIDFLVSRTLYVRLKDIITNKPIYTKTYKQLYGKYNQKPRTIQGITIFPIYGIAHSPPVKFNQDICNYTIHGRKAIHDKLKDYNYLIEYLLSNIHESEFTEFSDNKISLIAGQQGKCYVTGLKLEIGNMHCHHKIPREKGGNDEYSNLVWLNDNVHRLIHCTQQDTINKYLGLLSLNEKGIKNVNSLRKLVGNSVI